MKKFASISLHIALVGFIFTTAANLLHHRDAATMLFVCSFLLLLAGSMAALYHVLYNAGPVTSQKIFRIRKVGDWVIYISLTAFLLGICLAAFKIHYYDLDRQLVLVSSFGLLFAVVLALLLPVQVAGHTLTPLAYNLTILSRLITKLSLLCILSGFLFMLYHYPDGAELSRIGIALFFVFLLLNVYRNYIGKNNPVPHPPAIALDPAELDSYLGDYFNAQVNKHIIIGKSETGASLIGQVADNPPFSLNAINKNTFNDLATGVVLEFKPGSHELVLIRQGEYTPFIKTTSV